MIAQFVVKGFSGRMFGCFMLKVISETNLGRVLREWTCINPASGLRKKYSVLRVRRLCKEIGYENCDVICTCSEIEIVRMCNSMKNIYKGL